MYIHVQEYMYTHVHIHMYIHIYKYIYACVYLCIYIYTYYIGPWICRNSKGTLAESNLDHALEPFAASGSSAYSGSSAGNIRRAMDSQSSVRLAGPGASYLFVN